MTALPKQLKEDISALKKMLKAHRREEDKEFNRICKLAHIMPDSEAGESLFDHIYNDCQWTIQY